MNNFGRRRTISVIVAAILIIGAVLVPARFDAGPASLGAADRIAQKQLEVESQGTENGGPGGESAEFATASQQFTEARTAPGIVAPGAYSAAFAELTGLSAAGGSWSDVTKVPYDVARRRAVRAEQRGDDGRGPSPLQLARDGRPRAGADERAVDEDEGAQ
jgi:hypothetical protein